MRTCYKQNTFVLNIYERFFETFLHNAPTYIRITYVMFGASPSGIGVFATPIMAAASYSATAIFAHT